MRSGCTGRFGADCSRSAGSRGVTLSAGPGSIRFRRAPRRNRLRRIDSSMQRNVLLFVVLSFLVIAGFQFLLPSKPQQPPAGAPASGAAAKPGNPAAPPSSPPPAPSTQPPATPVPASAPSLEGRDITVENAYVRATFTTRGGGVKSWRMKTYRDTAGATLELVPQTVGTDVPLPFTLSVQDAALSNE